MEIDIGSRVAGLDTRSPLRMLSMIRIREYVRDYL